MNAIGQKTAQLFQSSRTLSSAQIFAGGVQTAIAQLSPNTPREISNKANQLSNRFIHVAKQQAVKGIIPTSRALGLIAPTLSSTNAISQASFSSKAGATQNSNFNFLESEDLAPVKRMYTALKDFSREFDSKRIAAKEIDRFGTACYNLQIAKGSDEIGLVKSTIHSSLAECMELLGQNEQQDKNPSPEEIQALNKLTSLENETMKFLLDYKRG